MLSFSCCHWCWRCSTCRFVVLHSDLLFDLYHIHLVGFVQMQCRGGAWPVVSRGRNVFALRRRFQRSDSALSSEPVSPVAISDVATVFFELRTAKETGYVSALVRS